MNVLTATSLLRLLQHRWLPHYFMRRGWFVVANCPPVIKVLMMLDSTQPCTEMDEMDQEGLVPFKSTAVKKS